MGDSKKKNHFLIFLRWCFNFLQFMYLLGSYMKTQHVGTWIYFRLHMCRDGVCYKELTSVTGLTDRSPTQALLMAERAPVSGALRFYIKKVD